VRDGSVSRGTSKWTAARLGRMHTKSSLLGLAILSVLTGCSLSQSPGSACARAADLMGPDFTVAGSFSTTVGAIRSLAPGDPQPPLWPDLAGNRNATLCYVDGPVAKSPPRPNASLYDRAAVAVYEDRQALVIAGYRDDLEVSAP
jgi:hypothetical protein